MTCARCRAGRAPGGRASWPATSTPRSTTPSCGAARPRLPRRRRAGRATGCADLADRTVAPPPAHRHRPRARRPPRPRRSRSARVRDPRLGPPRRARRPAAAPRCRPGRGLGCAPCCAFARREPSAVLLAAQLAGVLLYPFMEGSDVGRALFSVFGIAILGLVVLAVRSTPGLTWVGVLLGVAGDGAAADPGGDRQRRPAALLLGARGGPLLLRRRRADRLHARRPRDHARRALRGRRDLHARRVGVRLRLHRRARRSSRAASRRRSTRAATAPGWSCCS